MKKIINGYEITTCTAVAVGVDDARQPALFVHKLDDVNRDGDAVVFGWDLAWLEDDGDLEAMFDDQNAWAFDQETLATMEESKGGTKMTTARKLNVGEKVSVRYTAREIHRGRIGATLSVPFDGAATIERTESGYIVEAGNYVRYTCGDNRGLKNWKGALWDFLNSSDKRHGCDLISADEVSKEETK